MRNFGFKIVDDPGSAAALDAVVDYAVGHRLPVEVGIYHGDAGVHRQLQRRLAGASVPVNAHTHHERCHVFNFHQAPERLVEHIRQARALGSAYSVVHAANMPLTSRPGLQAALKAHLLDNLARAEALCEGHDYRLHVENVYHGLDFYRGLFEGVIARGLKRIHFCFDIGHAKVWSGQSLDDWLDFLAELASQDIRLHFHLHANRGLIDEHLALAEVEALGIGGPDSYFNAYGYPGAYRVVGQRFADSVKVFEVKLGLAIANFESALGASMQEGTSGAAERPAAAG